MDVFREGGVRSVGVIVAHPDDETLWAGGTMLMHRDRAWRVFALCRGSDPDRAPKFHRALAALGATGAIADLDDGPEQAPLDDEAVRAEVIRLVDGAAFDALVTHGPRGEYTRHRRHEETHRAVAGLWCEGRIDAGELWVFAYDDDGRRALPRAIPGAHAVVALSPEVWDEKYRVVTGIYGFGPDSWEARTTPQDEAFWRFRTAGEYRRWIEKECQCDEGFGAL
ncbi:MAG: PIG-L family deacetylase [Candidatus Hydrogenedentes bacterium]|nr:PIG-L family deacetylase [Candidatus Hydrogenedentota bacterium]